MKEFTKSFNAIIIPLVFVLIIWIVKLTEEILSLEFYNLGIYPLSLHGLKGVIFSPLIHGSFRHLISNTVPLLVLGWALFYFYKELGIRITLFGWLMSGLWVWVFARESYHIGASSVIYSWAAFLFVSGVIRRHPRLMALSLLITFLYGSMIWGIFPIKERISWEGHLMGMLSGIILAYFYRKTGLQQKVYIWETEPEPDDPDEAEPYWMAEQPAGDESQPENETRKSEN
jgi:membrane associated rhomboid family serine protease